ncbi:MAG: LysR family transcriptional regulator [Rhodospirillales bacterium]|nr:LysR family transcriptional regulator [Rhodospirillales bacterium]
MSISLAHLRAFHGVAREGGYSKAARVLNVSQPTLSLQIKALEEGYGVNLFERQGRGVRLTAFAEELLQTTSRLFATMDEVEDVLIGARDLKTGNINLGATGPHHIIPLMAAFETQYPGPRVSLFVRNARELIQLLHDRRIDVAQISFPPDEDGLQSIPIIVDPMVACVGLDHPWAKRKSVRFKDVIGERLLLRERGTATRTVMEEAFEETGLAPDHLTDIHDWESIRDLVAANLGVSVMSTADARDDARISQITVTGVKLRMPEHLVYFGERRRLRIVRLFLESAETALGLGKAKPQSSKG